MPISTECDLGQHEDCGGNGDMFGCTCRCHEAHDPQSAADILRGEPFDLPDSVHNAAIEATRRRLRELGK